MKLLNQFIAQYDAILERKQVEEIPQNPVAFLLYFTIPYITMGIIFYIFFPSETLLENLPYVVMAATTMFLGSFLFALYHQEENAKKVLPYRYSFVPYVTMKGLEKLFIYVASTVLILREFLDLYVPTYLYVLLDGILIVVGICILVVTVLQHKLDGLIGRMILQPILIGLTFITLQMALYIEDILIAFTVYTSIIYLGFWGRVFFNNHPFRFTNAYVRLKIVVLVIAFLLVYIFQYEVDREIKGKPHILTSYTLEQHTTIGDITDFVIFNDQIYFINSAFLQVADVDTGELLHVISGISYIDDYSQLILYDDILHVVTIDEEQNTHQYQITSDWTVTEESVDYRCSVGDPLEIELGTYNTQTIDYIVQKCPTTEGTYFDKSIFYNPELKGLSTIINPLTSTYIAGKEVEYFNNSSYRDYLFASLVNEVETSPSTGYLEIVDTKLTITDVRNNQQTVFATPVLVFQDNRTMSAIRDFIKMDTGYIFALSASRYSNFITSPIVTYRENGQLVEFVRPITHHVQFYNDRIYLTYKTDDGYEVYVLPQEDYASMVMPVYAKTSNDNEFSTTPFGNRYSETVQTGWIFNSFTTLLMLLIIGTPPIVIETKEE